VTVDERIEKLVHETEFLKASTESLHSSCQALLSAAEIQERRLQRMERIQTALLRGAGAFLKSLEEDSNGDAE